MNKETIINNHIPDVSKMVNKSKTLSYGGWAITDNRTEEEKEQQIKQLEEAYNKTCNNISLVKNYNENKYNKHNNKYWSWAMFNTCLLGVIGARIVFEWILEPIVKILFK